MVDDMDIIYEFKEVYFIKSSYGDKTKALAMAKEQNMSDDKNGWLDPEPECSWSTEAPCYIALVEKQGAYIKFLELEIEELTSFARKHGWVNKRHGGGQQHREEVEELRKAT